MKRLFAVTILALCCNFNVNAQGYNNLWLMGYENYAPLPWGATNIDFISGSPSIYFEPNRAMELQVTVVNVTDSSGSLLFYTNGAWIANRNNQMMANGDSINPSSFTNNYYQQGMRLVGSHIALKAPGNDSLYYLIHQTIDNPSAFRGYKCYYSIINMNLDSSKGEVVDKNHIFLVDTIRPQMAVTKHANGRDWWIVIPKADKSSYYIYILTPSGLFYNSKQTIGTRTISAGQAVFSRDGSLYASYDTYTDLEVFDFDRCSGIFSNPRHVAINDSMVGFGVSISPNNRFIYASSVKYVYQFDVLNLQNYLTVATWDSFYSPGPPFATLFLTQELMQDNKIYINTGNSTDYLHVIEYPDSLGIACQVNQHSLHLPTYNASSTPYYPNYFLGPVVGSVCDSLTVGISENAVKSAELKIKPNPCHDDVWINYHFPNNKDGWLEIYNSIGKLVDKRRLYWSTTQLLLHLNNLQAGMYIVKVKDDSGMYVSTGKLIKEL